MQLFDAGRAPNSDRRECGNWWTSAHSELAGAVAGASHEYQGGQDAPERRRSDDRQGACDGHGLNSELCLVAGLAVPPAPPDQKDKFRCSALPALALRRRGRR